MPENTTGKEKEISQHLFNIHSTVIQHPLNVELRENTQTIDKPIDTEAQEFIQQTTKDRGERGYVEQEPFNDVLQVEPIVNSSTTQQTKSLDPTSGQEAFQQKYQPVEVLNSEGEWISGDWVHKCLVVGNLEEIETKWALYDESGNKYPFFGEIRRARAE